jgi:colicin import membrane protein
LNGVCNEQDDKNMFLNFAKVGSLCVVTMLALLAAPASGQGVASTPASAAVQAPASSAVSATAASIPKPVSSAKKSAAARADIPATSADLLTRYPNGSIVSVEQAENALEDVKQRRAGIEARFKVDEKACYKTFLANQCVVKAKERRRIALAEIKPIQIQADHFKRRDAVVKRDKALEEKRKKEAGTVRPPEGVDERAEKFEAKHQRAEQKEPSAEQKRAENEAAFQKKVRDRELAQQKVEEKKAKTERRRKKKAASAAAAAAKRQGLPNASATSSKQ